MLAHTNLRREVLLVFLVVSAVYFATVTGVTSSNDGSHYALVRAIAAGRGFEISPYFSFTEEQDYATYNGRTLSDRPPGTAFVAVPLYVLGGISPAPPVELPSKHDPGNPQLVYAVMAAPLLMAGAVAVFYGVVRRFFGVGWQAAVIAAGALAFGTIAWKYGSVLYSHAAMAFLLWVGVWLLLHVEDSPGPPPVGTAFALGAVLGFAPMVEYTSAVWSVFSGVYLLAVLWQPFRAGLSDPIARRGWWSAVGAFVLGGVIPAAALMAYNTANFGGPFQLSRFYANLAIWPENESLATSFATPIGLGLRGLLFYAAGNQGLFLLSPIALLSLPGIPLLWRRSRRHTALMLGAFAVMLLLFSTSTTFNPGTNDGRYLAPFIGLWFVPLALWLDARWRSGGWGVWVSVVVFGLLFASVRSQAMHIALSWNYDLDRAALQPFAAAPQNIALVWGTLFRNAGNLPILWLWQGCALLLGWLVSRWRSMTTLTQATDSP